MPALVTLSLGSNIDPEHHVRLAVAMLEEVFGDLQISPVYQTQAIGFEGEDFLNLVVAFETDAGVYEVAARLKTIEDEIGRVRDGPRFSSRLIDIDLLTYDQQVIDQRGVQIPRHEILHNAFVLKPLSDIRAHDQHPLLGKSYAELWRNMEPVADRIDPYAMEFNS